MEPNSTLGEPIGVVHVTINGQKVPANVYADRTCIMPDGTIRKVKQEVVDALLAKKRAAEIPAQTPAQQTPAAQPFITRVQSQPVVQPVQPAAPAPTQATAEPARPSQKKKSSKVIAAILAVVIVGGVAGYAFVPSVYDGVNGVLTAVTGHQVGVPPVSENGDNDVITPQPTVNQPASGSTDTTSNEVNKVLGDIDMSGDVTIEFYANVKTADGREYKVPLSTANLTDGTLTSLLDSGGYPLTQNAQ